MGILPFETNISLTKVKSLWSSLVGVLGVVKAPTKKENIKMSLLFGSVQCQLLSIFHKKTAPVIYDVL